MPWRSDARAIPPAFRGKPAGASRIAPAGIVCLLAWFLAVVIAVVFAAPARAAAMWCSLEDGANHRGFVSDVRQVGDVPHTGRLSSRFRRTVNGAYGTLFSDDAGVCRQYPTRAAAERGLNEVRGDMLARQLEIIVVGIF
jgi:hypothetical protein